MDSNVHNVRYAHMKNSKSTCQLTTSGTKRTFDPNSSVNLVSSNPLPGICTVCKKPLNKGGKRFSPVSKTFIQRFKPCPNPDCYVNLYGRKKSKQLHNTKKSP